MNGQAKDNPSNLTPIERAAILRTVRVQVDAMKRDREHLERMSHLGDRTAEAAYMALDTEINLVESAVKKLWLERPP
jgi:hypothetical protein